MLLAQRVAYCLRAMDVLVDAGKRGRAPLHRRVGSSRLSGRSGLLRLADAGERLCACLCFLAALAARGGAIASRTGAPQAASTALISLPSVAQLMQNAFWPQPIARARTSLA